MATGKVTYTVKTRKDDDTLKANAVATALTIVFDGTTDDDLKAISAKQIVVSRQGYWRKHGIPKTDTVSAKDFAHGARQSLTVEVAEAVLLEGAKTDPAVRARLIAQLQAMTK